MLATVVSTLLCTCSKENLITPKKATDENALKTTSLAGNKYSVSVKLKSKDHVLGGCVWLYKDHSSFDVALDGSVSGTVSNIQNHNSDVTLIKNTTTCTVDLVAANQGNIDIPSGYHVAVFPFNHQVSISFDPDTVLTPEFKITCGADVSYQGGASGPAVPQNVQFIDNNQTQVFKTKPYTITVTPI